MGNADSTILRQRDLDGFVGRLEEIEIVYWEDGGASGSCGMGAWNGSRPEVPLGR